MPDNDNPTLSSLANILSNVNSCSLQAIKAVYWVAFGNEGEPRKLRKALRNFRGFNLDYDSYCHCFSIILDLYHTQIYTMLITIAQKTF